VLGPVRGISEGGPRSPAGAWSLDRLGAVAGLARRARVQRVGEAGADGEAITVIRIAEAEIGADLSRRLQSLLQACFPGYPGRSYFKLPPHFRYLAMTSNGDVAAQMGVEFRVIRVGGAVLRTFGIVDLCVTESQRSRGLAGTLLAEVTELARSCGMAFIVLFADDERLYARNGWARVTNRCSWVKIHDHVTLGLARQEDTGAMMVKAPGEQSWPEGDVDLLGHLF
jgi:GNAT superfamily N-acetyltransferase